VIFQQHQIIGIAGFFATIAPQHHTLVTDCNQGVRRKNKGPAVIRRASAQI
jgi:hypothetical protein